MMRGPKFVYTIMLRGIWLSLETGGQVQIMVKTSFEITVNVLVKVKVRNGHVSSIKRTHCKSLWCPLKTWKYSGVCATMCMCGDGRERQKEWKSYNLMIAHHWVQLTGCEMMMMMKSRCDAIIQKKCAHTSSQIRSSDSKVNVRALERSDLLGSRCLVGSELLAGRRSRKGQTETHTHSFVTLPLWGQSLNGYHWK